MGRVAFAKQVKDGCLTPQSTLPKLSRRLEMRWNALRCFCGKRNQNGSRTVIISLRPGIGTESPPSFKSFKTNSRQTTCRWILQEALEELDVYPQRISQYILSSDRISIALHITVWHLHGACTALCHCTYSRYSCLRSIVFRRCHVLHSFDSVRHESKRLPQ
jgi:hypothetical protein